jgi:glycosyltransferase involved in cell wall biosynthesis
MKVLHVDSAATWRGGQSQVLLTALGMARRGHAVAVACRTGGVLAQRAAAADLDVHPLPLAGDLAPRAIASLAALFGALRPDVVHAHDPHALATVVWAASVARPPLVVAQRRVDFPLRGPLSRFKYRRADRVIAVSRAILEIVADGGLARERLRLVYEGVSARPPLPLGRRALADLGIPEQALVVGNVAALTDHKDHVTLIDAAALVLERVPEARFLVLGEGELRPALEELILRRGLTGRFILAGFRSDIDALLPACDVFCLSSHLEGLGTSLLDAMMFGRAVVATAAGGIPEVVEDGVSGRLVPARDAGRLAEALIDVLRDNERRAAYGRAGRRRFEERFSAERMVEETLHVYAEGR